MSLIELATTTAPSCAQLSQGGKTAEQPRAKRAASWQGGRERSEWFCKGCDINPIEKCWGNIGRSQGQASEISRLHFGHAGRKGKDSGATAIVYAALYCCCYWVEHARGCCIRFNSYPIDHGGNRKREIDGLALNNAKIFFLSFSFHFVYIGCKVL